MSNWSKNYVLFFLFFSVQLFTLNAQDDVDGNVCNLLPPEEITITEMGSDYVEANWTPVIGALAYHVSFFDIVSGDIYFSELVYTNQVTATNISFDGEVYISLASICENGELGEAGGGYIESAGGPIGVSDIVMQMEGEGKPRILECEEVVYALDKITTNPVDLDFGTNQSIIVSLDYSSAVNSSLSFYQQKIVFNASGTLAGLVAPSKLQKVNSNHMQIKQSQGQSNVSFFDYSILNTELSIIFDSSILNNGTVSGTYRNCPIGRKLAIVKLEMRGTGESDDYRGLPGIGNTTIDSKAIDLLVFPNPAQTNITVVKPAEAVLVIRDLNGRVMHYDDHIQGQAAVSVNDWPSGIYIVDSIEDGQRSTYKFFKL